MSSKGKLHIAIPVELLTDLDKARGDVSRSMYVRRALEKYIYFIPKQRIPRIKTPEPVASKGVNKK